MNASAIPLTYPARPITRSHHMGSATPTSVQIAKIDAPDRIYAPYAMNSCASGTCLCSQTKTNCSPPPEWPPSCSPLAVLCLPLGNAGSVTTAGLLGEQSTPRGVHKLSRVPNPVDLQEVRINAPHGSFKIAFARRSSALSFRSCFISTRSSRVSRPRRSPRQHEPAAPTSAALPRARPGHGRPARSHARSRTPSRRRERAPQLGTSSGCHR